MKRLFAILAFLALASQAEAQSRVALNLTGWRYQNNSLYGSTTATTSDTLSGTTADTVFIGVLGNDNLYPQNVSFVIELTNTTGDCDTVAAYFDRGVGGLYQTDTVPDSLTFAITTTKTVNRTFVTASTDTRTLASVTLGGNDGGCTAYRIRLVGISVPATARVKYRIKAFGEYERN